MTAVCLVDINKGVYVFLACQGQVSGNTSVFCTPCQRKNNHSLLPGPNLYGFKSCACVPACNAVCVINLSYTQVHDAFLCLPDCDMHRWLGSCDRWWRRNPTSMCAFWVVFLCMQTALPILSRGQTGSDLWGNVFSLTSLRVDVSPSEYDGWWAGDVFKVKVIFGILLTFDVLSGLPSQHLLSICLIMLYKKILYL